MGYSIKNDGSGIIDGPLGPAMWAMTWPLLLTSLATSLIGLVDMYLAGLTGQSAQAALGIGEQIIFLCVILGTGLASGTSACVSRAIGANNEQLARLHARDSITLALVFGLLAAGLQLLAARPTVHLFAPDPETALLAIRYLELSAAGNLPFIAAMSLTAVYRAVAAPRYSLYLWLIISSITIGGSFTLVFAAPQAVQPIDALALAWDIGCTIGSVLGILWFHQLWSMDRRSTGQAGTVGPALRAPQRRLFRMKEQLLIGLPAILADVSWLLSNALVYRVLSGIDNATQAQAAWSIVLKLEEAFAAMPLLALSLGAGAIVGQCLGAGKANRARQAGWKLAFTGAALMGISGTLMLTFSSLFASLLSSDALVNKYTVLLLQGTPIFLPLLAIWLILFGCIEGAGLTHISMMQNLVGFLLIRLPLAFVLCWFCGWGLQGVWAAISVSRVFMAASAIWNFKSKRWQVIGATAKSPPHVFSI